MRVASWLLVAALGSGALACAAAPEAASPPRPPEARQLLELADVLPLRDRTVSTFLSRADDGSETTFMLEIFRPSAGLAHLVIAGRTQRLTVSERRIEATSGGVLLAAPLTVGATFRGAFGTVTIREIEVPITVPAGRFERCVVTVEETRAPPKRAEAAYCEGVGLARLVVEGGGERLVNELVSHAARVEL
jgi:hypothetical protein